jgi:hypothetical protein
LKHVQLSRIEVNLLAGLPVPPGLELKLAPTPEQLAELAAFDRDAAMGEGLDPDNAYFPMMRAVGLLAARQDAQALAAIRRAGEKPRWEDYCGQEVEAKWRLCAAAGLPGAIPRTCTTAATLLPQFFPIIDGSSVATYLATQAEVAGRPEEGLAIRRALGKFGSLLRVQARWQIGAHAGIAITRTAMSRPGGSPPIPEVGPDEGRQARLNVFCNYLERVGHPDQAQWWRAESAAADQVKALTAGMFRES